MDELPPHARALLDAARDADDPTPAERARADARARQTLAQHGVHDLPSPAQQTASAAAGSTRFGVWLKTGLGGAALIAAALGLHALHSERSLRAPATVEPSRSERSAPAEPVSSRDRAAGPAAPSSPGVSGAGSGEQPQAARDWQDPSAALGSGAGASASAPGSAASAAHSSENSARQRDRARSGGPAEVRGRDALRGSQGRHAVRSSALMEDDAALREELRRLAQADQLIRQAQFDAALQLLDVSAGQPSAGGLLEERKALRLIALCGKNANASALLQRDQFLRAAPRAVLAARVRAACVLPDGGLP